MSLLSEEGVPLRRVETDSVGSFIFELPEPGSYYLRAERTGYVPKTDGVLDFDHRGSEIGVEFYLLPDPMELPGLEVGVDGTAGRYDPLVRRRLDNFGFFERQRVGTGTFRTPAELEARASWTTRELFQGIPRLRLIPGAGVGGQSLGLQCTVGPGGSSRYRFGGFVNGIEVFRGSQWDVAADVPLLDVVAVEAYTSVAQMPLEFAKPGLCGVILVWTR